MGMSGNGNMGVANMGVNHGGTNPPPQNLQWGTLIQVVPPDFCHFSKFQALAMDSSPPDFNPDLRHWRQTEASSQWGDNQFRFLEVPEKTPIFIFFSKNLPPPEICRPRRPSSPPNGETASDCMTRMWLCYNGLES
jgi:hypothetical protein